MVLPDLTNQFIADSYKGILHTSNVPVSGDNLPPVYDGLGNKTSLSIGALGISVSGTLSATGLDLSIINSIYPIGSVLFSADDSNPSTRFIGTIWKRIAQGRFVAGEGDGNDGTSIHPISYGENAGKYTNNITLPPHSHGVGVFSSTINDDAFFIIQNWNDGQSYTMRAVTGDSNTNITLPSITGTPNGIITSPPINVGSGATIDNKPPGFGLYIWERTS